MDDEDYMPRIVDATVSKKLRTTGAVLIEGARFIGKSTTGLHFSKSSINLDDPVRTEEYAKQSELNPQILLEGENPRLIDEWQLAPRLWNTVRRETDRRRGKGLFILTGSSTPADMSGVQHSGTGRFSWVKMRPMTLFESNESNGALSLGEMFEGDRLTGAVSPMDGLGDVAFATCRGGWPEAVMMEKPVSLGLPKEYVNAIVRTDLSRADGVRKDLSRAKRLMRSYARNQGTQASNNTIGKDIFSSDETVSRYINALKATFVAEDLPAWNPNLRSKTAIRGTPTRYFVDPSIATASLSVGPSGLLADIDTFGFIFETLCVRDLRVYAESLEGELFHYRDADGLECDAVVALDDGRYGLIEIKLGGDTEVNKAIKTLNRLSGKIDADVMGPPSFKMVLTAATKYARYDGDVLVAPISCLKNRTPSGLRVRIRRTRSIDSVHRAVTALAKEPIDQVLDHYPVPRTVEDAIQGQYRLREVVADAFQ